MNQQELCNVSGCDHPRHCHAGRTKQQNANGSPVCVRCFNLGILPLAWHEFVSSVNEGKANAEI